MRGVNQCLSFRVYIREIIRKQKGIFKLTQIIKDRKIKFALIGCGRISARHFEAVYGDETAGIAANADAEFVDICDTDQNALKEACEKYNIRGHSDYREMLSKTDADVVATQGAIIELLVPPDKKGGKGSPKMQQMMQQMMAQATQARKAGGNNGKFDSGFVGDVAQGTAVKDTTGNRRVEKAGGVGNAGEWPEEFRDQLQAFFQQVEGGAK